MDYLCRNPRSEQLWWLRSASTSVFLYEDGNKQAGSFAQAQEYREALLDAVAELDDDVMEAYLDVRALPIR